MGIRSRLRKRTSKELPPKRGHRLLSPDAVLAACEYPAEAVEIIRGSTFTTHHRVGIHRHLRAANVLNDFFDREHFEDRRVVEFGPGHYSFAMLARALGAEVVCLERYDVHVRLGRALGFEVHDVDFRSLTPEHLGGPVDGLWMKGAFNACQFASEHDVRAFVELQTRLIRPEGWGWCVTVNMTPKDHPPDEPFLQRRMEVQREAYADAGWDLLPIREDDRKRYAVSYQGSTHYFVRNLPLAAEAAALPGQGSA